MLKTRKGYPDLLVVRKEGSVDRPKETGDPRVWEHRQAKDARHPSIGGVVLHYEALLMILKNEVNYFLGCWFNKSLLS